jgi:hypothetical protein
MDKIYDNNQKSVEHGLTVKRQVQVEAISKAIYLVTDLFDKDEFLKLSLRRIAVECVEKTDKKDSLLKLLSLIRLSRELDLITEMNSRILIKAIDSNIENIEKKDVDIKALIEVEDRPEITHNNEIIPFINKEVEVEKKAPSITINNNTQNIKTVNNISMDIGSRRKRILEIVKTRGAVTINEFIEAIKGCSSKTIQRELTSLVLSGTLKKTGERRWSKYSLK